MSSTNCFVKVLTLAGILRIVKSFLRLRSNYGTSGNSRHVGGPNLGESLAFLLSNAFDSNSDNSAMNQQANQKLSTYLCCIGREREAKEYLVFAVLYGRLFKA